MNKKLANFVMRRSFKTISKTFLCITSSLLCTLIIQPKTQAQMIHEHETDLPTVPFEFTNLINRLKAGEFPADPLDKRYESLWVGGIDLATFLTTGQDTDGRYTLADYSVLPGSGAPPHIHHLEAEWFYIYNGELSFIMGNEFVTATPGTLLYGPRDHIHGFINVGDTKARMLVEWTPSGIENFFREGSDPINPADPFTPPLPPHPDQLHDLGLKYGIEFLARQPISPPKAVPEYSPLSGVITLGALIAISSLSRSFKQSKQKKCL